ncbi:hypothetical protein B0H14DRAFT_2692234 [Mycena olivaceomarginata]|nr:hypothetical protein B0H14DRAFT_2692234 [Mycena olivaceomarginata]
MLQIDRSAKTTKQLTAVEEGPLAKLFSRLNDLERLRAEASDELLQVLQAAQIRDLSHENESTQMQERITNLEGQVDDWKEQAEFWQHRYIELEEKLLALSRSASMRSPSKHDPDPQTPSVHSRFLKALPSPTESNASAELLSRRAPSLGHTDYQSDASTPGRIGQEPAYGPREISRRFVRAVVRVKTEDDEDDEESVVARAVADPNSSRGDIWERESDGDEESTDELMLGDVSPVPASSPAKRMRTSEAHASPKRRKMSDVSRANAY